MTGPSTDDLERVYGYLVEYITAKKYPPSGNEIAQAMGRAGTRRIRAAIEALQQLGKIQVFQPTRGRRDIRLANIATQKVNITIAAAHSWPKSIPLTPGPIICIQCANPVCKQSKTRCALHLQLAREASERLHRRRGIKPRRPGVPGRRLHRRRGVSAMPKILIGSS